MNWVKQSLCTLVSDMALYDGTDLCDIPAPVIDSFSWRIQSTYRELLAAELHGGMNTPEEHDIL